MESIFVTGTDTDAGKTVAAAALLAVVRDDGIDAVPMKPIQTGCELRNGVWHVPDLAFVTKACGLSISPDDRDLVCPYTFEPACSPHLAAEMAGISISYEKIIEAFAMLKSRHSVVIAEGAGGIMVPVDRKIMMLDLMKAMGLPVVLVTRPGLGTINHTLLSLNQLRHAGMTVAGVVFCETNPPARDFIESDNRITIEQSGGVPVLGTVSYVEDMERLINSPKEFLEFSRQSLPKALDALKELKVP